MAKHATSRTLNPSGDYSVGGYFARTPHVQFLSLPSPPYEDLSHTVLAKQVFRVHTASRTKVTHSSEGHYGFRVLLFFFCLRQRRIPYTVYGRAGLAGTSSISAYCLFGVVHISVNVNQVIEFIPTV
uniref:ORF126B protein n=1 Tax=Turritis glabra TaxID=63678 RepID=A0A5H2UY99_TURGL|nr:ORF126B protein [Turritis glabra]